MGLFWGAWIGKRKPTVAKTTHWFAHRGDSFNEVSFTI
jgi:hypothetical protein